MKRYLLTTVLLLTSVAGLPIASAQTASSVQFQRNRFGLNYRMGFNITASFQNLGGYPASPIEIPNGSQFNREYDDGYVRVDSTGNLPLPGTPVGGDTTYWGYQNASQVTAGNQSVVMHQSSSAADGEVPEAGGGLQNGLELTYNRILGYSGGAFWGVEAALGYTYVNIEDQSTVSSTVTRISDSFNLGGIPVAPAAPYDGPYTAAPGVPLLGDTPTRSMSTIPGGASISGNRKFTADLYGVRIGPFLCFPVARRLAVTMSGGLALVSVNSDFQFQDTVTMPGTGSLPQSGSGTDSDVLVGGYFTGNLNYALTRKFEMFFGFQYQNVGTYDQTVAGKKASLDLGSSIFLTLGAGYSF